MSYSNKLSSEEKIYLIKIICLCIICGFLSAKYVIYLIKLIYMIYTDMLTHLFHPDVIMGLEGI